MHLACPTCQSQEFYEDEQGYFYCAVCGTQSQERFAESFETDHVVTRNQMKYITRRDPNSSNKVRLRREEESDPDTLQYLLVYQFCLRFLTNELAQLCHCPELEKHAKNIWMRYLKTFRSAEAKVFDIFSPMNRTTVEQKLHVLYPLKPLFMGILYLSVRQLRLPVLPADLIRWCISGHLSYDTIWIKIPMTMKTSIGSKYKRFLDCTHKTNAGFITAENIWFHTTHLAHMLGMGPVPVLNTGLCAYLLMRRLGYPAVLWDVWITLTQATTRNLPLQSFDFVAPHREWSEMDLLATVTAAIKCCANWTLWCYSFSSDLLRAVRASRRRPLRLEESLFPMPVSMDEWNLWVGAIPASANDADQQQLLRIVLRQFAESLRPVDRYNALARHLTPALTAAPPPTQRSGEVEKILELNASNPNIYVNSISGAKKGQYTHNFISLETIQHVYQHLHAETTVPATVDVEELPEETPRLATRPLYLGRRRSLRKKGDFLRTMQGVKPYLIYGREEDKQSWPVHVSGMFHYAYIATVERLAKYCGAPPQTLHECVTAVDQEILNHVEAVPLRDQERKRKLVEFLLTPARGRDKPPETTSSVIHEDPTRLFAETVGRRELRNLLRWMYLVSELTKSMRSSDPSDDSSSGEGEDYAAADVML